MRRSVKKRAVVLSLAVMLSASLVFAANNNEIVDLKFEESGDSVAVVVVSKSGFKSILRAVKSGIYYNIIIPNAHRGSLSTFTPGGKIESVRLTTIESSGGGNYTKIQIKPAKGVVVTARGLVATPEMLESIRSRQEALSVQDSQVENDDFAEKSAKEEFVEDDSDAMTSISVEDSKQGLEEIPAAEPVRKSKRNNTTEILNILIGSFAVFLVVIILYINGRNKMKQLCGDMGVDIDDTEEKAKKEEQKRKQQEKEERKRKEIERKKLQKALKAQREAEIAAEKALKKAKLVDMSANPLESVEDISQPSETPAEEVVQTIHQEDAGTTYEDDDYDLDEFLESFVDKDSEEDSSVKSEDLQQDVNQENAGDDSSSPIDDLVEDVIAAQSISFSEADIEALQKGLQSEVSPDLLEQVAVAKMTKNEPKKQEYVPITLEDFDKKYPELSDVLINELVSNENIKFSKDDRRIIYEVMAANDMSQDAIEEARLRKAKEDEANKDFYEKEQDFAFKLIKTDEASSTGESIIVEEDEYPDVANTDFSGDAIFKEFSFASPDVITEYGDEAPSLEDIEAAMANMTLSEMSEEEAKQYEKPENDPILSEFKLIEPDVTSKKTDDDDGFSSTVFTSVEDIDAQFKALGLVFDSETQQPAESDNGESESVKENEEDVNSDLPLAEPQGSESVEESTSVDIYAKCQLDETTELYIAYHEGKTVLMGIKDGNAKRLYEFEDGNIPSKLTAREAEETVSGKRYIVKSGKFKFVIEVTKTDVILVLVL